MSDEKVLFHNDEFNVTVTDQRLILRDEVTDISTIRHAAMANHNGCRDYAVAILFAVIGLICVLQLNGWSILGLFLWINPLLVFFVKKKYWVFVFCKPEGTVEDNGPGGSRRMYTKEVAIQMTEAINLAAGKYAVDNDPRKGLNL